MLRLFGVFLFVLQLNVCYQTCLTDDESYYCLSPEECAKRRKVIFRDRCLSKCPEWVHFFENKTRTCYPECPSDTVVNGFACLTPETCTVRQQVVFNRTCVPSCPVHSPYTNNGVCYSDCPSNRVSMGTDCIEPVRCTGSGYYIFKTTCLKSCPSETKFIKYGTCLHTCTPDTVKYGISSCVYDKDCIKLKKIVYNGTCLDTCPSAAPHNVSGRCYSQCPHGYIMNDGMCISVSECTKTKLKFISNGTCVDACPADAPLLVENNKTCFSECPHPLVNHESHCISKQTCTDITKYYKVIFNGTCIQRCPATARFIQDRNCLSKCPDNSVTDGTDCIGEYECKAKGLLYNGRCVTSCPSEARIQKDKECIEACPKYTVNDDDRCIDKYKCTNKHKVIFNWTCVDECPNEAPYHNDGNCLVECPSNPDYKFSISHVTSGSDSYDESDFLVGMNGTKCIDIVKCAENGQFIYNLTCVSECPPGTSTDPNKSSPWNNICISLEETKRLALLFSGCWLTNLVFVIVLVYNPRKVKNKEDQLQQKGDNETLDPQGPEMVVQITEPEQQPNLNTDHDHEEDEPDIYQAENHARTEIQANVDVHNDFPLYDDDIPLLPLDDNDAGNDFENSDDDDALLFGNGH